MLTVFRDPMWTFIGALIGLIAVIVTIWVYFIQRRRKSLSYEIVSTTPIISHESEVKGAIQITFNNEPIRNVVLFIITLTNSGNAPIAAADYERPIRVRFETGTRLLTVDITEVNPSELEPIVQIANSNDNLSDNSTIELLPILLNSKDSFTFKTLVSHQYREPKEITVDGRLVGINTIRRKTTRRGLGISPMNVMFGAIAMVVILYIPIQVFGRLPIEQLAQDSPIIGWGLVILLILFFGSIVVAILAFIMLIFGLMKEIDSLGKH